MSNSRQFAIMSLHVGQKYYHKVCANYLSYSSMSSIDSGKGSYTHITDKEDDYTMDIRTPVTGHLYMYILVRYSFNAFTLSKNWALAGGVPLSHVILFIFH